MKKQQITKKSEKGEELSLNHGKALRFRKRIQEDKEKKQELKRWLDGQTVQKYDSAGEGNT